MDKVINIYELILKECERVKSSKYRLECEGTISKEMQNLEDIINNLLGSGSLTTKECKTLCEIVNLDLKRIRA